MGETSASSREKNTRAAIDNDSPCWRVPVASCPGDVAKRTMKKRKCIATLVVCSLLWSASSFILIQKYGVRSKLAVLVSSRSVESFGDGYTGPITKAGFPHPPRGAIRVRNLLNVTYPTFPMRSLNFLDDTSRKLFGTGTCTTDLLATYNTEDKLWGQVLAIDNGIYPGPRYDCGYRSRIDQMTAEAGGPRLDVKYRRAAPLVVPDSWSFQHFLDGSLPKLVQALSILANDSEVQIILDRLPRDQIVLEILDHLGYGPDRIVYMNFAKEKIRAEVLYYLCWTPPLHPTLWQRSQHLLGVYDGDGPQDLVVLLVRNRKNSFNGGRMMSNQDAVASYLRRRYGEKFVEFDSGQVARDNKGVRQGLLRNTVKTFRRARIIIGVHGGAMYNQQFARRGTHVVELVPIRGGRYVLPRCMIFVIANLLDQIYWHVTVPAMDHRGNVDIPMDTLNTALSRIDDKNFAFVTNPDSRREDDDSPGSLLVNTSGLTT